jgi:hypothetical protein
MPNRRRRSPALLFVLLVAGCGAAVQSPATPSSSAPLVPAALGGCPDRPFDPAVRLDPMFASDLFPGDETEAMASALVDRLEGIYAARPGVDPCEAFTGRGLQAALRVDPRLAAVARGQVRIDSQLIFRGRFEGAYDLRRRPPTVPLDVIFDIDAGARVTDAATGAVTISADRERVGLGVVLQFDGHAWRVDQVGPVSDENAAWARLPEPPRAGPPCTGFRRDPRGVPFDERAGTTLGAILPGRPWCDDHGAGRDIRVPGQLTFFTRYPCDRGGMAVLSLAEPLGGGLDPLDRREYLRDPKGEAAANGWLTGPYDGDAALPPDAVDTGWTNGNVDLWESPSDVDDAVYLVRGDVVERWPRATKDWGVIDCN